MSLLETELTVDAIRPGDDEFAAAARVLFADGDPAMVVRPRDPDEVAAAIAYAVRHELAISVRSGGHSLLGYGTNDGGMVLDMRHFDRIEVLDRQRRIVRIGGGATWGQVSAALDPYGWSITAGDTREVGVGGLTLGGGIGWMVRRYGLAIDSLVGARIVTADGRLLCASANESSELFWALRGGGGNFGVVVDFDFVAQPVATVHFGSVNYRLGDPVELLRGWRDAMREAPEELTSSVALMPGAARVLLCYAGEPDVDPDDVDELISPLFSLGMVTEATVAERRYSEILESADQMPPGLRVLARNTLVPTLDNATIEAVAAFHAAASAVAIRSLGGAFGRVPGEATAFAHRDAEAMIVGMQMLPAAADSAQAMHPWRPVAERGTGVYLNFQGSATAADLRAAYPATTYARLAAVKRTYDPDNVFARNHNISPA